VEKKDPPIITKIRKTKERFDSVSLNEIPIFETLLEIDTSKFKKLFLLLKKTKIIEIIINK
tara:strand:- start:50 stop:232 length:183 start_codon:yes stop_codon:yes gene_type:complete